MLLPRLVEGMCPAEDRGERLGTVEAPEGIDQSDFLEQERRIFYVGLTRAIEAVYLERPPVGASRFVAEQAPPRPARPEKAARSASSSSPPDRPAESGRAWQPDDDERLAAGWAAREGLEALAVRLGRSKAAVAARLVRLGVVGSRAEARGEA